MDPATDHALHALRAVLEAEPEVAYALLFGSGGRGVMRRDSDLDIAVEFRRGAPRDTGTLGRLAARLESAAGRRVDLVLVHPRFADDPRAAFVTRRMPRDLVEAIMDGLRKAGLDVPPETR